MGLLDRWLAADAPAASGRDAASAGDGARAADDGRVVAQYRHVLGTAPAETLERVHDDAFAGLSDEQRALIYERLSRGAGTGERPLSSEPATLAHAAARREQRRAGTMWDTLDDGSELLVLVARQVVRSPLVGAFLPWDAGYPRRGGTAGRRAGASRRSAAHGDVA